MEQLVQVFGPLAVPTLICLAAGVLLLLIELFTPGFGVAGGLGLLLLAAVVVMQLLFGSPAVAAYIAAACWALPFIIYIFLPRRRAEGIGEQKMPVEPVLATYLGEYEYDTSDGAGRWQMFACHWQGSDYRMPVSSKRRGLVPGQQLTLYRDRRSGMVGDVGDMIEKAGERRGL